MSFADKMQIYSVSLGRQPEIALSNMPDLISKPQNF